MASDSAAFGCAPCPQVCQRRLSHRAVSHARAPFMVSLGIRKYSDDYTVMMCYTHAVLLLPRMHRYDSDGRNLVMIRDAASGRSMSVSRRALLRYAGVAALAVSGASLLAACGASAATTTAATSTAATTATASGAATAAASSMATG